MAQKQTFILAGGGTGGHIYPNIAVAQALQARAKARGDAVEILLAVSQREIDREIVSHEPYEAVCLPIEPARRSLKSILRFARTVRQSVRLLKQKMQGREGAVLCTGGFVSVPAALAARRLDWPTAVVNLDAVPGKANAWLSKLAHQTFVTSALSECPKHYQRIAFPVREAARVTMSASQARKQLQLHEQKPTLLVTAGSQGARSINHMMHLLASQIERCPVLLEQRWQVYHLCGREDQAILQRAYAYAGIHAVVEPFQPQMGLAWAAADVAISRAGAGSVAEVQLNTVPTLFFPYPYHQDEHQRLNALPLVEANAAVLCKDHIEANENLNALLPVLSPMLVDQQARQTMREKLQAMQKEDGAAVLADWLLTHR